MVYMTTMQCKGPYYLEAKTGRGAPLPVIQTIITYAFIR